MLHAMDAAFRREELLAAARRADLVAQLGASNSGWLSIRRRLRSAAQSAVKARTLLSSGVAWNGAAFAKAIR